MHEMESFPVRPKHSALPGFDGSEAATVRLAQRQWQAQGQQRAAFCPICRTRGCAHMEKLETEIRLQQKHILKRDVFGASPPNIFVGYSGYPSVNLGPLVALEPDLDAQGFDNPVGWYGHSLADIVHFRSLLARGKKRHSVKTDSRELSDMQDVVNRPALEGIYLRRKLANHEATGN